MKSPGNGFRGDQWRISSKPTSGAFGGAKGFIARNLLAPIATQSKRGWCRCAIIPLHRAILWLSILVSRLA